MKDREASRMNRDERQPAEQPSRGECKRTSLQIYFQLYFQLEPVHIEQQPVRQQQERNKHIGARRGRQWR